MKSMNKIAKISAAVMLVAMSGCSNIGSKTEDNSIASVNSETPEISESSETQNDVTVTKDNFMDFPTSDVSLFHGYVRDEGYVLSGVYSDDESVKIPKVLVIPAEIDGAPVVEIEKYVFSYDCSECEAIVLPDTVKYIDHSAFSGDKSSTALKARFNGRDEVCSSSKR